MRTRCPHCQTVFRVTAAQLAARAGRVRCGRCGRAFDALANLHDEPTPPRIVLPPAGVERHFEMPRVPDEVRLARGLYEADGFSETSHLLTSETPHPDEPVAAPAMPPEKAAPMDREPPPASQTPSDEPLPSPDAEEATRAPTPAEAPSEPAAPAEAFLPAETAAPSSEAALQEPPKTPETTPAQAPSEPAEPAEPATEAAPSTSHRPRRWPWAVGSVFLLLMLLVQGASLFRVELAALWPEWRPTFVAWCGELGCEMPFPREPKHLALDHSDLAPQTGRRLELVAVIRNRAPYALAYPHLELTLTDARDETLARRVFPPAEWLPPGRDPAQGFPAGEEIEARLVLETKDLPAVGYRLYLFYP